MKKATLNHLLWLAFVLAIIVIAGALWGGFRTEKYEDGTKGNSACGTPKPAGPTCSADVKDYIPAGSFLNEKGTQVKNASGQNRTMFCSCDKFGTTTAGDSTGCNTVECNCFEKPENVPTDSKGRKAAYVQGQKQTLFLQNMTVEKDICVNAQGKIIYRGDLDNKIGSCPNDASAATLERNKALRQKIEADIKAVQEVRAWEDAQKSCPATETKAESFTNIEPFSDSDFAPCY